MRTDKLFIGALAVLFIGLASCSNEEPVGNSGGTDDSSKDGYKYVAVTISSAGIGNNGRALTDGGYEPGVGTECKIEHTDVYFYFYDDFGNPFPLAAANVHGTTVSNMVQPSEIDVQHNPGNSDQLRGILVLGKPVGEGYVGQTPSQMLCLVNPTLGTKSLINRPLRDVLTETSNSPIAGWTTNGSKFLMSSSTYMDETGKVVTATALKGKNADGTEWSKFADTKESAEEAPVNIYIERAVAKIRAIGFSEKWPVQKREEDGKTSTKYVVDNEETELYVQLTGWQLRNTADQCYTFKNVGTDNYFDGWNDYSRHRCYWALSHPGTINNPTYSIYDTNQFKLGNWDGDTDLVDIAYCYENTSYAADPNAENPVTDRGKDTKTTAIVVRAVVEQKTKAEDGTDVYVPIDMVRWAGAYYTMQTFKELVAQNRNAQLLETQPKVTADMVELIPSGNNDNKYKAQIRNGVDITPMDANFNNISWWKDGVTSYYANIEHLIGNRLGVVRNHIYEYKFTGVIGLGVPGDDPENPTEEEETFLAATINCLNWHVVSNSMVLE